MKNVQLDEDIKTEYENQKKYLNNSVTTIKKRLETERKTHKEAHLNIMKTNVNLIDEIKKLRTEVVKLDSQLKKDKNSFKDAERNQRELMNRNRDPLL